MSDTVQTTRSAGGHERLKPLITTLGMRPILVLLAVGFHRVTGNFLSIDSISIVMQRASINIVLAAGVTFVILTGGIDLSVGSILAAAAMVAMIGSPWAGASFLAIPLALPFGLLFGLVNESCVAFLKPPPFIVTLGGPTAVRGVARLMGGDATIFNSNLSFGFLGNGTLLGAP